MNDYSTVAHLEGLRDGVRPSIRFSARTRKEWEQWRSELKARVTQLLHVNTKRVPTDARVLDQWDAEGFAVEKLELRVEPDLWMPTYVLVPAGKTPPFRAVVGLHGHGGGKDDVVGITAGDADRINLVYRMRADYAATYARRGYLVIVPEARGFGERAEPGACQKLTLHAQLIGRDITGMRVSDAMAAVDYLVRRPDVVQGDIASVGLSMGGWLSMLLSALDERITVSVVAGFFNTFARAFLSSHTHCPCHYTPGLYAVADIPDLAGLIAPKPLLITSGTKDYFPIEGAREAFAQLKPVYDLLGAGDRLRHDAFEGGHEFSQTVPFEWVDQWMLK